MTVGSGIERDSVCICSDIQRVLREDREKLRLLQKSQPRFSEEQKKELIKVHPWFQKGSLPKAIDIKVEWPFYCIFVFKSAYVCLEKDIENVHFSALCFIFIAFKQAKVYTLSLSTSLEKRCYD